MATPKKKIQSRRFSVTFDVEGTMIDDDTVLSAQSLEAFIELHFSQRRDSRLLRVEAKELKD